MALGKRPLAFKMSSGLRKRNWRVLPPHRGPRRTGWVVDLDEDEVPAHARSVVPVVGKTATADSRLASGDGFKRVVSPMLNAKPRWPDNLPYTALRADEKQGRARWQKITTAKGRTAATEAQWGAASTSIERFGAVIKTFFRKSLVAPKSLVRAKKRADQYQSVNSTPNP